MSEFDIKETIFVLKILMFLYCEPLIISLSLAYVGVAGLDGLLPLIAISQTSNEFQILTARILSMKEEKEKQHPCGSSRGSLRATSWGPTGGRQRGQTARWVVTDYKIERDHSLQNCSSDSWGTTRTPCHGVWQGLWSVQWKPTSCKDWELKSKNVSSEE